MAGTSAQIRLCRIRCLKSLIAHILWVREESHFLFGGQDHKPLFPFRFTVAGTSIQQEVRVSMPLELPGYPPAADVYIALCFYGSPFVFRGIHSMKHFHNFSFVIPRKNRKTGILFTISYIKHVATNEINTINKNCPATPIDNCKAKKPTTTRIGIWRM